MSTRKENLQVRAGDKLFNDLIQKIFRGVLKPGEKLPTEQEMATQYGLARGTVSEVIGKLEELKVVKGRRGSGITVLDYRKTAGLAFAREILKGDVDASLFMEILDYREHTNVIHVRETALALSKVTMNDILALEEIDHRLESYLEEGKYEEAVEAEEDYRSETARIVGNLFLMLQDNAIRPVFRPSLYLFVRTPYARVFVQTRRAYFRRALMEKKSFLEYEAEMRELNSRVIPLQNQVMLEMLKEKGSNLWRSKDD